jgi:hypothetical protein
MNRQLRILALLAAGLLLIGGLVACQKEPQPPSEPTSASEPEQSEQPEQPEPPAYPTVDTGDLDALADTYLAALADSGWLSESWEHKDGMAPDGIEKKAGANSTPIRVTDAAQTEDVLTLWVEGLDPKDGKTPLYASVVTLRLEGDGFVYLSCEHTPADTLTYTGPEDAVLPHMSPAWLMAAAVVLGAAIWLLRRQVRAAVQRIF